MTLARSGEENSRGQSSDILRMRTWSEPLFFSLKVPRANFYTRFIVPPCFDSFGDSDSRPSE